MRSLEKLWTVVYKIDQSRQITPEGKHVRINPRTSFYAKLDPVDIENIFELLQNDVGVIKIIEEPSSQKNLRIDPDQDMYVLDVLPTFEKYMNELYARYSFGVEKLDNLSFLRVYDVAFDVHNELQLTDGADISIRIMPTMIRFRELFPNDSFAMRDEHSRHRWSAINFLKKIGAFTKCELDEGTREPYSTLAQITVNRMEFDRVFEKLQDKYRTVVGGHKQEQLLPRPTFDMQKGIIVFRDKSSEIEIGTVAYYICLLTFEKFGEKIEELKVIDVAGKRDTKRVVYDAHRRLNKKVKDELGIPHLFGYGSARVWVRAEQFEPEKEQEKQPENVSYM